MGGCGRDLFGEENFILRSCGKGGVADDIWNRAVRGMVVYSVW